MACFERRIIEKHQEFARSICDFIYIEGKGKKGIQEHTVEEYQTFLTELKEALFDTYNDAAERMGWIEETRLD